MYRDTITLYNRRRSKTGDIWYPTVLKNVDLNTDRAAIAAKYGTEAQDKALLHIRYMSEDFVGGKQWLPPKVWQSGERPAETITFTDGEHFDFFCAGAREDIAPIRDNDYLPDGFYNYMNRRYDYVFAVTSAAKYSVIPHFEITGK